MSKKLRRRCNYCREVMDVVSAENVETLPEGNTDWGLAVNMVAWRTDPFKVEIHDNHTRNWLCFSCAHERYMDT